MNSAIFYHLLAGILANLFFTGCLSSKFIEPVGLDFAILDSSEVSRGYDGLLKHEGATIEAGKILSWYAPNKLESEATVIGGITRSCTSYKVDGSVASKFAGGTGIMPRYHYPGGELWSKAYFRRGRIISVSYFKKGKQIKNVPLQWGQTLQSPIREALKNSGEAISNRLGDAGGALTRGGKAILDVIDPDTAVVPDRRLDEKSSWGEIGQAYLGLGEMTIELPFVLLKSVFGSSSTKGRWRHD